MRSTHTFDDHPEDLKKKAPSGNWSRIQRERERERERVWGMGVGLGQRLEAGTAESRRGCAGGHSPTPLQELHADGRPREEGRAHRGGACGVAPRARFPT